MTLAWLNATLDGVEQYPLSLRGLQALFPNTSFPSDITSWLPGDPREPNLPDRLVIVRPVARPAAERWEQVVELMPELSAGVWQQAWQVSNRMTLQEAKIMIGERAVSIWWEKLLERPTLSDALNADFDGVAGIIQPRNTELQPLVQQFRTDVENASTFEELWQLLEQLEGFA